jgi:glycosyltransferase involved in cell wall biosynthesis
LLDSRQGAERDQERRPVLSIVIPTYNRLEPLSRTLAHLYEHLPDGVEVVIVDDGSEDATSEAIPRLYPGAVFLRCDRRGGPGVARNLALTVARGSHFLPLDSDCFIVPETLHWLVLRLARGEGENLVLPCRSWPQRRRAVEVTPERPYRDRDFLLKTYGEVVPVLSLDALRRHGLSYPDLFGGGEPLLLVELSRREPILFLDRVILEYRTDLPSRISSAEYQMQYPAEIARVFEAYLPYLRDPDEEIRAELGRVREKAGAYWLLAGRRRQAVRHLLISLRLGRMSSLLFLLALLLPNGWTRRLFTEVRRRRSH